MAKAPPKERMTEQANRIKHGSVTMPDPVSVPDL